MTAWGVNTYGQTNVPSGLTNVIAIAAGAEHTVALKADGTVTAWARDDSGQTNAGGWGKVTAIAAGGAHNLALLSNGTVQACGAPIGTQPANLTNVTAVAAGLDFNRALRANGSVTAWGGNSYGQTNVPANLSNVVAIAAGDSHALALKRDGHVVAWGWNAYGQTNVPTTLTNTMAIAAGSRFSLALRNDGTVVAWGDNAQGQTDVITNLPAVKLIAAGGAQALASVFSTLTQYPVDVSKDLLLIYNTNSLDSSHVCAYYLAHRPMVSNANVLGITCTTNETFMTNEYATVFAPQIQNWLSLNPTKRPQYVILFPTIPSRVNWYSNGPPGVYWEVGATPSVQYRLHTFTQGWRPFVSSINMNGTNDCVAYINKLAAFGTNGHVVISASAGGYGNSDYYFEDAGRLNVGNGIDAWAGVLAIGMPTNVAHYAGLSDPHWRQATNVAGFFTWGYNGGMGNQYVSVPNSPFSVRFYGDSAWYLYQTGESFNGVRINDSPIFPTEHPIFLEWYSSVAFGGANYSRTPACGVTHVDEPGSPGNVSSLLFALWAEGRRFGCCAWSSHKTVYFQAVGDPLIAR